MHAARMKVSVVVTTYNWPEALERVLHALSLQTALPEEVVVADDGSGDKVATVIQSWLGKAPFRLRYCWQPDEGFRAAMIRNRAVALTSSDYLIFLDGDCIPLPRFVENHKRLAEKGWFVSGNRILLQPTFTEAVLSQKIPVWHYSWRAWGKVVRERGCHRRWPLLSLPLGQLRKWRAKRWQGAKTCNLGVFREDFLKVNGLEESYVGWGLEDSDFVVRLIYANVRRKAGKFAIPVVHLWHPEADRASLSAHQAQLKHTLKEKRFLAKQGVDQYL